MSALPADVATALAGIILRASDDPVKTDLEVTCRDCRAVLCDAEHGDTLDTLAAVALDHLDVCPGEGTPGQNRESYTDDQDERPRTTCGCGFDLVWVEGRWEHDAAPYLWGDDHDADAPPPEGPARDYWDQVDGVTD